MKQIEDVCADVEGALSQSAQVYKNSTNVTAASVISASGRRLVVRRMNYGKWKHRLKDAFRPSRARRAFYRGLRLERANIPTPQMLAVAEVRRLRWPLAAYLISEEVVGARTLFEIAESGHCCPPRVVENLANVVARMHDCGFIHRDLKAANIVFDHEFKPWLIDMDGLRFVRHVSVSRIARDFAVMARILVEHPQLARPALRFLVCYCRQRDLTPRRISRLIVQRRSSQSRGTPPL